MRSLKTISYRTWMFTYVYSSLKLNGYNKNVIITFMVRYENGNEL